MPKSDNTNVLDKVAKSALWERAGVSGGAP